MEKWPLCQELLKLYPPDKIRDDMIDDINLRQSTQESEYITRTLWHTDKGYHAIALNRAKRIIDSPETTPQRAMQNPDHLHAIISEVVSCIAGLTPLADLPEYYLSRGFDRTAVEFYLVQKDLFSTRKEYLEYLWSIRELDWGWGTRHRVIPVRLMQAGLEDKKFFDFVAPGIRSSYPQYIPMLEFFQRSTGLNYETLRQALKHEDYEVFSWAVKKISSQHITELYEDLRLAINNLIGRSVRKVDRVFVSMLDSPEVQERTFIEGRGGNLRLFIRYRYLPFDHKVLIFDYEPGHFDLFPPFQLYPIPANPKIKEEYQVRKSEKLY
ncbi:MAG: hypothetical protein H3C47_16335 [Candidatus Cloacimonetes bacterium]|nr:hypothetical protein [Candidatus Cloacimonadota bacterium]